MVAVPMELVAPAAEAAAKPAAAVANGAGTGLAALPAAAQAGMACEAAAEGDVAGLRALVQAGLDVNLGTPYDKRTALHLAAASGRLEMVRFLTEECGARLQQDRFGLLPIHDAVQNGHTEVRRYLQGQRLQFSDGYLSGPKRKFHSCESLLDEAKGQALEEATNTVFELIVKEGVFSYSTVHAEVQHFFNVLNLHPVYFEHFTPLQIAKHVHCLIAAKRVARATEDTDRMDFALRGRDGAGFFLTTIACPTPTQAQVRTEQKVAKYLQEARGDRSNIALTFMASEGPAMPGSGERLGIFTAELGRFEALRVAEGETSLEVLAAPRFLKAKTQVAKEQYQIVMEDIVALRRSVVRIVPGHVYPGPYPGGFVLLFGTAEPASSCFFQELMASMRFEGLSPRRFYLETFANGVLVYSTFFPSAKEAEVQRLKRTIMYSTMLKAFPGKSERVYSAVMSAKITQEVGLYLLAAVKFVYAFFPKEQYVREYTTVHKVLEQDPASQRKLEALYKLCMKELLCTERIYELVQKHLDLAQMLFRDFKRIALGEAEPHYNEELGEAIDAACAEPQDRQILRMILTFNAGLLLTNFFQAETPGAFAFRLDPAVVLKDRPRNLYPALPYAIYFVHARDFQGFHVRFRDVARGGIRLVLSRDQPTYERNLSTLFDECYNLALTQQYKNKDIPEGGAKGVILPDSSWPTAQAGNLVSGASSQCPASQRSCFVRYLNALLDCMLPAQSGAFAGHMKGREELLFFGPDENTAGFMDLGAELARVRGYRFWKALTTGKSVRLGGVPHDVYGMTTASVHTYVLELLRELNLAEESITKFQTGGPDGDLGSNEILVSKDKTVAVVDGSGVLYDPEGLNRAELVRLAQRRVPVKEFSRAFLSAKGFLVTVDETDVTLPDGTRWRTGAEVRDQFHLSSFAKADLFVPCGGRPNSVSTDNVQRLFEGERPKFRMVVEGANLFFSDGARAALERAGVHVFKDASTNKGGVTSSSLEVFAALALSPEEHGELMTYSPEDGGLPPAFYETYVQQVLEVIRCNATQEFQAIWACSRDEGLAKAEATRLLSTKINQVQDSIQGNLEVLMSPEERGVLVRQVLRRALPPLLVERIGVEGVLQRVPPNYIGAVVGAWVASRFVYRHGVSASEVSFFCFMRSLLRAEDVEMGA